MSKQRRFRSSKLAAKKRKQKNRKIIIFSILIIAVIIGLSYFSGHQKVTIENISISENEFVNDEDVINKTKEFMNDRILLLFSRKNFLLVPDNEIRNYILDNYPSIESVEITNGINNLEIVVNEYSPVAKWCGIDFNEPSDCYLLNKESIFYAKENPIQNKEVVVFYGASDINLSEELVGQRYIELEIFEKTINFVDNLNQLEINPIFVDTTDVETFAVYTERGPYLLIEKNDDPNEVLNNLKTVIETEEINDAQYRNLEYVDLRFGNKVYYKIR